MPEGLTPDEMALWIAVFASNCRCHAKPHEFALKRADEAIAYLRNRSK